MDTPTDQVPDAPGASELIEYIRDSVIGDDEATEGPFGPRRVTYADYTASGRSLSFIEDYLRAAVLPRYANTHTESSGTGRQTTRFREEARAHHRDRGRRGPGRHAVIFAGSGSTGAIHKLVDVLGLRLPSELDERYALRDQIPAAERPVVFIGPYEHHSNELPWRESIADVVTIHEDADGRIDLAQLERELVRHADRPLRIGSLLGSVQRHRHPLGYAGGLGAAPSPRRAVVLGLRRRGALRGDRDGTASCRPGGDTTRRTSTRRTRCSSRSTSSSADRARPASWWPGATCSRTGCPTVVGGGTVPT